MTGIARRDHGHELPGHADRDIQMQLAAEEVVYRVPFARGFRQLSAAVGA